MQNPSQHRAIALLGVILILASGCDPDTAPGKDDRNEASDSGGHCDRDGIRTVRGPSLSAPPLLSDQARALSPPHEATGVPTGLEREDWEVEDYGNPAQVLTVTLKNTPESALRPTRLAVELFGGPAYSTALGIEGTWRLSTADDAETILVIYSATAAAVQGSLAYRLSSKYLWHESRSFILEPGWNTIRVRQGAADFKTQSSNWQHTAALWRPDDCRGITLLIHNRQRTGRLFIERIRISEDAGASAPRPDRQSP